MDVVALEIIAEAGEAAGDAFAGGVGRDGECGGDGGDVELLEKAQGEGGLFVGGESGQACVEELFEGLLFFLGGGGLSWGDHGGSPFVRAAAAVALAGVLTDKTGDGKEPGGERGATVGASGVCARG